ncbi:peptidase [bacterium SM23_31]|nr:MAG: peptidase [bacterium SM23_31]
MFFMSAQPSQSPQAVQEQLEFSDEDFIGCTSIMVGKLASTDGSVMTAHSCDGNYRTWLRIEPHAKHEPGTMTELRSGYLHTEFPQDRNRVSRKGEIPQVPETYAFMNVAYPCMNEKQLGIGETTIGGRRELRNNEGMFMIEELQRIVLERCTTAREAIRLIGELVKQYGYGDSGECLTFVDPKEVWHFEIMGAGPIEIGAVWAAVRLPDDHVGVSANIPRISTLDVNNPDYYMASDNVFSLAEEMGWWDPNSGVPFKFWEAYSGRRPYSTREFYVLSTMAPSLDLNMDMEELPFSVKPDKKVSIRDMMRYYRETYEGTELDITKDILIPQYTRPRRGEPQPAEQQPPQMVKSPLAGPWMSSDLRTLVNAFKPETVGSVRAIASSGCSYSQIIQCRDWLPDEIGGIAWFSFGNPGQSPRIPIFAGTTELPGSFEMCGQKKYRTDAALWTFRFTNRLANVKWGVARIDIEGAVQDFEERALEELPGLEQKVRELYKEDPEKCKKFVTRYTNDFALATMAKWRELGEKFITTLLR